MTARSRELKSRNVLIVISTAGLTGWQKRNGVFRYIGEGRPWNVKLATTSEELNSFWERRAQIDGLIVSMPDINPDLYGFADTDIPTVLFNINMPRTSNIFARPKGVVFLHQDSSRIGEIAADHLLSSGIFRSFVFLAPANQIPWADQREKTFTATIRKCGLPCVRLAADSNPSDAAQALLALQRPIGLFAASDRIALTAFAIAETAGLKVPEELSIIGVDNDESICESTSPALSSIAFSPDRFGYMAAKLLDELISHPGRPSRNVTLNGTPNVVTRDSTPGPKPYGHLVEKAIAYIKYHATDKIGPDDVATHLHISRRLLDLRFSQVGQGTVLSTIQNHKLQAVAEMLQNTSHPLDRIAQTCGYGSPNHLMKVFKRAFGMTMLEYRAKHR